MATLAAARTFEAPIILIDLEWEHLMNEQQIRSVAKQVVSGVNSVGTEQSNEAHCGKLARQWGQQLASRPAGLQRRPFTQVRYCYAANCKTERPVALWLSGLSTELCLCTVQTGADLATKRSASPSLLAVRLWAVCSCRPR